MRPKGQKRTSRVKTTARRQLPTHPTDREVKDILVGAIEASLTESLENMGFTKREVEGLLLGSTKALTEAVREKLRRRAVKK